MEFEQIKEIMNKLDTSSITEIEIKQDKFHLKISKNIQQYTQDTPNRESQPQQVAPQISSIQSEEAPKQEIKMGEIIKCPIVGTFYESANPKNPPFVSVGDTIKEGDVLCIIEAMKVMNEVRSQYSGTIAEIYAKNEDMVEYNKPLFRII